MPTLVVLALVACGKEGPVVEESSSPIDAPGIALRQLALSSSASELGFTPDSDFPTVYGVLTDWDLGGVVATILSLRDGTASLYTTSTFGVIGGREHERVRQVAVRYVKAAERFVASAKPVSESPYPDSGTVFFYLLTYDGVRRLSASQNAIETGSDPAAALFAAAQDVLAQLRMISDSGAAEE